MGKTTGIVFDIREFSIHDGPGIRTTVFMKGCPLACSWCHNPEGISPDPQVLKSTAGERIVGREYSAEELADILNGQADILRANEGGVTFSGGEPLMQAEFVAEVIDRLHDVHVVLDTSGFGTKGAFETLSKRANLVHFDLKQIDTALFRHYTGRENGAILGNFRLLPGLGVPYVVRVPLVPGVTDTPENLLAIAKICRGMAGLVRVELLTYNKAAGGKYDAAGMRFEPGYDESSPVNTDTSYFTDAGIEVKVA